MLAVTEWGYEDCCRAYKISLPVSYDVERAAAGEPVCITRRGKAVAQITAIDAPRKPIDLKALKAITDACRYRRRPPESSSAGCAMKTAIDALSGHLTARLSIDQ